MAKHVEYEKYQKLRKNSELYYLWDEGLRADKSGNRHRMAEFLCSCGESVIKSVSEVKRGRVKTCGHIKRRVTKRERRTWRGMLYRCNNKKSPNFKRYGGRGITVCERWLDYENFIDDMGSAPSVTHQLDRIDNNGNYEPNNCQWVTPSQNMNNTWRARWWVINGVRYPSASEAGRAIGQPSKIVRCWCLGESPYGKVPLKKGCHTELKYNNT